MAELREIVDMLDGKMFSLNESIMKISGEQSGAETGSIQDRNQNGQGQEDGAAGRKQLLTGGLCCGIVLFVASNFQQFGIQYTTVGKAGFITAMYIVIVPLLGLLVHRKVGLQVWIGVLFGIAGLYLLCMKDSFRLEKETRWCWSALLFFHCIFW